MSDDVGCAVLLNLGPYIFDKPSQGRLPSVGQLSHSRILSRMLMQWFYLFDSIYIMSNSKWILFCPLFS